MNTPLIHEVRTVPDNWADPLFTQEEALRMLKNTTTRLWLYSPADNTSPEGHLMVQDDGDMVDILTLWVSIENRRKGVARGLLHALLEDSASKGRSKVMLDVRPSNTPALHLYQKCGFSQVATRVGYYKNPQEDAWVLEKRLP